MTAGILKLCVSLFAIGLVYPGVIHAQNAQCTILSAQNFGKVVPVTINPAPAANAPCMVGQEMGYVSKTSSGIGVNSNAICTITVSGQTVQVAYEANSSIINSPCKVGNVSGYISKSSAPAYVPTAPIFGWQAAANGSIPPGAVIGGWEKVQTKPGSTAVTRQGVLYICRANFNGDTFTGKVFENSCHFGAGNGKENLAANYEVLTVQKGYSLVWQGTGAPPAKAVMGGHAGQYLYLCQLPYQGGLHPGWVVPLPPANTCSIGYAGKEVQEPGFTYLIPMKAVPID